MTYLEKVFIGNGLLPNAKIVKRKARRYLVNFFVGPIAVLFVLVFSLMSYAAINTPALDYIGSLNTTGVVELSWSDESATGATQYELQRDTKSDFSVSPKSIWVSNADYTKIFTESEPGTYFFRVKAWNAAKTESSEWSNVENVPVIFIPDIGISHNTPDELKAKLDQLYTYFDTQHFHNKDLFLQDVFKDTFNYFLDADIHNLTYGFPRAGHLPNDPAALHWCNGTEIGYYLNALLTGLEWDLITEGQFKTRISATLDTLITLQADPDQHFKGQFYTYYYMKTEGVGEGDIMPYHTWWGMVPSIDNAFFACSLIITREYAEEKGYSDIAAKADTIVRAMDFRLYWDPRERKFSLGFDMETNDFLRYDNGKNITWDAYANETPIMTLIAYATGAINEEEFKQNIDALWHNGAAYTDEDDFEIIVNPCGWDGSYFTYLMPGNFMKVNEARFGKVASLPAAISHMMWAKDNNIQRFGWSDMMTGPAAGIPMEAGSPPSLHQYAYHDWTTYDEHIAPYCMFMGLNLISETEDDYTEAISKLQEISLYNAYQLKQTVNYGTYGFFEGARSDGNDAAAPEPLYGTLDEFYVLAAIFNYYGVINGTPTLRDYFYKDENVAKAAAYMEEKFRERFSNAFIEAEDYIDYTGSFNKISRDAASGGYTLKGTGDVNYNMSLDADVNNAIIKMVYTDDIGGAEVQVWLDGEYILTTTLESTEALGVFEKTKQLSFAGLISKGNRAITLKVNSGASNLELDYFVIYSGVPVEPVENFQGAWNSANWWTTDAQEPSQYELTLIDADQYHGEMGYAMKVVYDKSKGDDLSIRKYGGFAATITPFDFSEHDYFSFWVYNDGSPLVMRVELEDTSGNKWATGWGPASDDDLCMRTAAGDWENLVVDLTRTFGSAGIDMTSIANIIFVANPGNTTTSGAFWIDDVTLQKAPEEAPIEVFEADHYGWSTAFYTLSLSSEEFHNEGNADSLGQRSLKVSWPEKNLLFHNIVYDVTHDPDAPVSRIGNLQDLTVGGNSALSAWIKSDTDTNFEIQVRVFDVEPVEHPEELGANLGKQLYTGAGEWQKLSWDYGGKKEASKTEVIYFFPMPSKGDPDGGIMYIDDVVLEGVASLSMTEEIYAFLDDIIRQLDEVEEQIEFAGYAATAAAAGYIIYDFLKDYKRGVEEFKGEVVTWKGAFTHWAHNHPGTTYWGGIYGFAGGSSALFWEGLESYGELGFAIKLGWTAAFGVSMANVGKAVVPLILTRITEDYILPELDFSAGIPSEYRSVLIVPVRSGSPESAQELIEFLEGDYLVNNDPNNNLPIGIVSDSKGEALQAEIDGIKSLESKYGQKFFLMHRVPRYWNEKHMRKQGWWMKPGAVYEFNAWLMNDYQELQLPHTGKAGSGDSAARQIGADKCFDMWYGLGQDIPQGSSGTVAGLGDIFAVLTLDEGNYDPGSKIPGTDTPIGGMTRVLAKLAHPDNVVSPGDYKHKMVQPMMGPPPDMELDTWWQKTLAREQKRMKYTAIAYNNVFMSGTFYGKGGYILEPTYNALKGFEPDFLLSHDIVDGEMLNCAFATDIECIDDVPTNAIAQTIRDARWATGDVFNLPYTGFMNVGTFPMFTNKVPTETFGMVRNPFDINSRIKIFENVRARVGDTALLTFFMTGYLAKTTPDIIAVGNPLLTESLFWGTMIAIVGAPKLIGVKNAKDLGYAALDTGVTTACLLPNVFQNTVNLYAALKKLASGDVRDIDWPTAASAEQSLTLNEAIRTFLRGEAVGISLLVGSAALDIPITPKELIMLSSWSGGGALVSWMSAGKSVEERKTALLSEISEFKKWVAKAVHEGIYGYQFPADRVEGLPTEPIKISDMESIIKLSYMYDDMAEFELVYGPNEARIAALSYKLSSDKNTLLIDTTAVSNSIAADTGGMLAAEEAARLLMLHAYTLNKDTLCQIAAYLSLVDQEAKPLKVALNSMVSEGYLTYMGESGGYKHYNIELSMLEATFTINNEGTPGTLAVSGTEEFVNVQIGAVDVIVGGVSMAKSVGMKEGKIKFRGIEGGDWTLDMDTLLAELNKIGISNLQFTLGTGNKMVSITSDKFFLDGVEYYRAGSRLNCGLIMGEWYGDAFTTASVEVKNSINAFGGLNSGNLFAFECNSRGVWEIKMAGDASAAWKYGRGVGAEWTVFRNGASLTGQTEIAFAGGTVKLTGTPGVIEVWGEQFNNKAMANGARVYKVMDLRINIPSDMPLHKRVFVIYPQRNIIGHIMMHDVSASVVEVAADGGAVRPWSFWKDAHYHVTGTLRYAEGTGEEIVLYGERTPPYSAEAKVDFIHREPVGFKRSVYGLAEFLSTPKGTFVAIGTLNAISIGAKMYAGHYTRADNERLIADTIRLGVDAGTWSVGVGCLNVARSMGMVASGAGAVYILPIAAVAHCATTYADALYLERDRVDELDLEASGQTILYRAWLDTIKSLKGDVTPDSTAINLSIWVPDNDTAENMFITLPIADYLFEEYLLGEGADASGNEQQAWYYDIAFKTGERYGKMFKEEVANVLYRGLCWRSFIGLGDEYGSARVQSIADYNSTYPLIESDILSGAGPAPLGGTVVEEIRDELFKGIRKLWKKWKNGDGFEPISGHLGGTPSIPDITVMLLLELANIKESSAAYIKNCYEYPMLWSNVPAYVYIWQPAFPIIGGGNWWLDCRRVMLTCDELIEELLQSDLPFAVGAGTAFTFEGTGKISEEPVHTEVEIYTNSYDVPADTTTPGAKYNWDVRGRNEAGEGERSEKGEFITE